MSIAKSPQSTFTLLIVPVPATEVMVRVIDCPRKAVVLSSVKLTVGGTRFWVMLREKAPLPAR